MLEFAKDVNEYLLKIQQGDLTYVQPLYDRTFYHLYGMALLYLVNKSFAEDVVAETFVHVISYVHSFKSTENGYNWLCKIAQNIARSKNLKEKRIADAEATYINDHKEFIENDPGFDEVEFFFTIRDLDEIDQVVAVHRFYLGETQEEIGRHLNISKSAVNQRLKKIYKIFKKNFKNK